VFVTWLMRTHSPTTSTDDPSGMDASTAFFVIRSTTNTMTATTATRMTRREVTPLMLSAPYAPGFATIRITMSASRIVITGPYCWVRFAAAMNSGVGGPAFTMWTIFSSSGVWTRIAR